MQVQVLHQAPQTSIETGGKPVFFSGPCTVDGPVADAKFGVVTQSHPIMWRKVEVFQWRETATQVEERRGDQARRGTKYSYKAEWSSQFVSSSGFKDPKYRQNIAPDVHDETIHGGQVRVGNFYTVGLSDLERAFGRTQLRDLRQPGGAPSAEWDRNGVWAVDSRNGCLVRQRNPGKDTVGDIRIKYEVLQDFDRAHTGGVYVSVCGVPGGNSIHPWRILSCSVQKGVTSLQSIMNKYAV